MARRIFIGIVVLGLVIVGVVSALWLSNGVAGGEPDLRATQQASETDCADLYPAGSQAYKLCIEGG